MERYCQRRQHGIGKHIVKMHIPEKCMEWIEIGVYFWCKVLAKEIKGNQMNEDEGDWEWYYVEFHKENACASAVQVVYLLDMQLLRMHKTKT